MDMNLMSSCPAIPGEMLEELYMKPLSLTVNCLADKLKIPSKALSALISGSEAVTVDMAMRLGKAFSTTPELWLNAQRNVDVWKAIHGDRSWDQAEVIYE